MTHQAPLRTPLKLARQKKGLTQLQLALAAGVHPASVSLAERGSLSAGMALRFAAVLGVPPSYLMSSAPSDELGEAK